MHFWHGNTRQSDKIAEQCSSDCRRAGDMEIFTPDLSQNKG
jgi:hypothetical protein